MNKCYVVLDMCERLKNGEIIYLSKSCMEYGISEPTFRRYISTLRNFFCEKFGLEIMYVPDEKGYKVKNIP